MKTGDRFSSKEDVKKLLGNIHGIGVVIVKGRDGLWRIYDEPKKFKKSKAECRALHFNLVGAKIIHKEAEIIISGHGSDNSDNSYCQKIEGSMFCKTCSL